MESDTVQVPQTPVQCKSPDLCEIWTWQGDTSILPFKFESVLNAVAMPKDHIGFGSQKFNHADLKKEYIDRKEFDPEGFFFITYRSTAIGLAVTIKNNEEWTIPFLTAIPGYNGKGVENCLLNLVMQYLQKKQATSARFIVH